MSYYQKYYRRNSAFKRNLDTSLTNYILNGAWKMTVCGNNTQ